LTMNQKSWDKLPAEIQQVFNDVDGEYAAKMFGDAWWKIELANKDIYAKTMNGKFISLPPADQAAIDTTFSNEVTKTFADLEAKGYPIQKVYSKYLEIEKPYETNRP
jgi:TRAP-type C4-dicarboxylate transport system substrate-binding protein